MSYTVFIQKFTAGESSNFEFSELESILSQYRKIINGEFGIEFRSSSDLFEDTTLEKSKPDIDGISLHRLNNTDEPRPMTFEILKINETCFFDQDPDFLRIRTSN